MSRIFTFYIIRQVLQAVLIVLLALVGIGVLFDFIGQIKHLDKEHVNLVHIIAVVVYAVPGSIYETFPPSVLIGSLLALGGMAGKSELIAMRAATVSKLHISAMVAVTGILLMFFIVSVGELLLPAAEAKKEQVKAKIKWNIDSDQLRDVWLREGTQFIHIEKVVSNDELHKVRVYEIQDDKIKSTLEAAKAIKINNAWFISSAKKKLYIQDEMQLEELNDVSFDWGFDLSLLRALDQKSTALSVKSLYNYVEYMESNNLDSSRYRLSFWLKILSPLTVMVMLMLALPFAFGSLRTMAAGNLIVIGLVIGLIYYITSGIASNLGYLYGFPPFVNAFAPSLLFVAIALFLMLKQKF